MILPVETILLILLTTFLSWEVDREKPKPYPLGNGDTLMVRIVGYEFCPTHCETDHFHTGHKKGYDCESLTCSHIIYEDRLN